MAKILVVDDDPVILAFISGLLGDEGYDVATAEDGSSALESARRERPDLVVSDLIMPYRDGYELLREIKADRDLSEVPVILMSIKDQEQGIVRALDLGAADYVVKPFGAHELLARIRKVLRDANLEGGS